MMIPFIPVGIISLMLCIPVLVWSEYLLLWTALLLLLTSTREIVKRYRMHLESKIHATFVRVAGESAGQLLKSLPIPAGLGCLMWLNAFDIVSYIALGVSCFRNKSGRKWFIINAIARIVKVTGIADDPLVERLEAESTAIPVVGEVDTDEPVAESIFRTVFGKITVPDKAKLAYFNTAMSAERNLTLLIQMAIQFYEWIVSRLFYANVYDAMDTAETFATEASDFLTLHRSPTMNFEDHVKVRTLRARGIALRARMAYDDPHVGPKIPAPMLVIIQNVTTLSDSLETMIKGAQMKMKPIHIMMYGPSSVGKTQLCKIIRKWACSYLCPGQDLEHASLMCYDYGANVNGRMDGCTPTHLLFVWEDFAIATDVTVTAPEARTLCGCSDTNPNFVDVADMMWKRNAYTMFEIIITTTNKDMHADVDFGLEDNGAVGRRVTFMLHMDESVDRKMEIDDGLKLHWVAKSGKRVDEMLTIPELLALIRREHVHEKAEFLKTEKSSAADIATMDKWSLQDSVRLNRLAQLKGGERVWQRGQTKAPAVLPEYDPQLLANLLDLKLTMTPVNFQALMFLLVSNHEADYLTFRMALLELPAYRRLLASTTRHSDGMLAFKQIFVGRPRDTTETMRIYMTLRPLLTDLAQEEDIPDVADSDDESFDHEVEVDEDVSSHIKIGVIKEVEPDDVTVLQEKLVEMEAHARRVIDEIERGDFDVSEPAPEFTPVVSVSDPVELTPAAAAGMFDRVKGYVKSLSDPFAHLPSPNLGRKVRVKGEIDVVPNAEDFSKTRFRIMSILENRVPYADWIADFVAHWHNSILCSMGFTWAFMFWWMPVPWLICTMISLQLWNMVTLVTPTSRRMKIQAAVGFFIILIVSVIWLTWNKKVKEPKYDLNGELIEDGDGSELGDDVLKKPKTILTIPESYERQRKRMRRKAIPEASVDGLVEIPKAIEKNLLLTYAKNEILVYDKQPKLITPWFGRSYWPPPLAVIHAPDAVISARIDTMYPSLYVKPAMLKYIERIMGLDGPVHVAVIGEVHSDRNQLEMMRSASANCGQLVVVLNETKNTFSCVFVGGRGVITVKHAFAGVVPETKVKIWRSNVEYIVEYKSLKFFPTDGDWVAFECDRIDATDLKKKFVEASRLPTMGVTVDVQVTRYGWDLSRNTLVETEARKLKVTDCNFDTDGKYTTRGGILVAMSSIAGDCGKAYWMANPHSDGKILGIHFASVDGFSVVKIITREELMKIPWTVTPANRSLDDIAKESGVTIQVKGEAVKKAVEECPSGIALVAVAKFPAHMNEKSKIAPSPLQKWVTPTDAPARIGPWKNENGEDVYPEDYYLSRLPKKIYSLGDQFFLKAEANEEYLVPKPHGALGSVLTNKQVLNGEPGTSLNDMRTDTSCGIRHSRRFPTKLGYFIVETSVGLEVEFNRSDIGNNIDLSRFAEDDIAKVEAILRERVPFHVMKDSWKDELYDLIKVLLGKSRIVSAGDVATLFLAKKYLGAWLEANKHYFPYGNSQVGWDPQSREFHEFVTWLLNNSDLFFAMDVKGWDLNTLLEIFQSRNRTCLRWYKLHFNEEFDHPNQIIRSNLLALFLMHYHITRDLIHVRMGGQGSGQIQTETQNGGGNRIMHKAWYLDNYDDGSFDTHVRVGFYGDDSAGTISRERSQTLTPQSYAAWCKKKLHLTVENFDGTECTEKFFKMEEIEFVSRRPMRYGGLILGVMDKKRIVQIPCWVRNVDPLQTGGLMRQSMQSALIEATLHGEVFYNAVLAVYNRCLVEENMAPIMTTHQQQWAAIMQRAD